MASKGRSNFLRLFCDFLAKEFSRVDHVDLDTPLEDMLDESGKVAFVDYLEDRMRPHVLGVSRDAVFVRVTDVASLYEKLCLACKAFPSFIEATPDSSDSEDEPPVQVQEKKKLVTSKKGNVLAALIDAGDDAGDDLLEEQLGLVTAVQISERTHVPGKCIECEDREAVVDCVQCTDEVREKGAGKRRKTESNALPFFQVLCCLLFGASSQGKSQQTRDAAQKGPRGSGADCAEPAAAHEGD